MERTPTRCFLAWIAAIAIAIALIPGVVATSQAFADEAALTINTQLGSGEPTEVKAYTADGLNALVGDCSDMKAAHYGKGVYAAKTYVAVDDLLNDAGVTLEDGDQLIVAAGGTRPATYTFSSDEYNNAVWFYPNYDGGETPSTDGAQNIGKAVIGIEWAGGKWSDTITTAQQAYDDGYANAQNTGSLLFCIGQLDWAQSAENMNTSGKRTLSDVVSLTVVKADNTSVWIAQGSDDNVVKTYDIDALNTFAAENTDTNKACTFGKGVIAAKTYVTVDQLLNGAGVTFGEGQVLVVTAGGSKPGTHAFTYEEYNAATKFYPNFDGKERNTDGETEIGRAVIGIEWGQGKFSDTITTAQQAFDAAYAGAYYSQNLRFCIGQDPAAYADPSNGDAMSGMRSLTDVIGLTVLSAQDLSAAEVTGIDSVYIWTGEAQQPVPTVTLAGKALDPRDDYTVAYAANTDPGTATVTITGKGSYSGSVQKTFNIIKFKDVPDTHWVVKEGLYEAVGMGLVSGYKTAGVLNGNFGPEDNIKRQDVAVILYRSAVEDASDTQDAAKYAANNTPFKDVDGKQYYTAAINWAYENGIMKGDDGTGHTTTRPGENITRQELALMLQRYADGAGKAADGGYKAASDAGDVPNWAAAGIDWAYTNSVMTGKTINGVKKLDPWANTTRAEATKMILVTVHLMDDANA